MLTNQPDLTETRTDTRLPWIEPAVTHLHVKETAQNNGEGGDLEFSRGGNKLPDCTRS